MSPNVISVYIGFSVIYAMGVAPFSWCLLHFVLLRVKHAWHGSLLKSLVVLLAA